MKTIFKTYEGDLICESRYGTDYYERAILLAVKRGCDSLMAFLPDGQERDYTDLMRRKYLPKFQSLKQAA